MRERGEGDERRLQTERSSENDIWASADRCNQANYNRARRFLPPMSMAPEIEIERVDPRGLEFSLYYFVTVSPVHIYNKPKLPALGWAC